MATLPKALLQALTANTNPGTVYVVVLHKALSRVSGRKVYRAEPEQLAKELNHTIIWRPK